MENNDENPAPQEDILGRCAIGVVAGCCELRLSPDFACFSEGRAVKGGSSRSALVTSTGVLELDDLKSSVDDEPKVARCVQRSRTPSMALKKLADPTVIVLVTASRAGASCCSNFRSCIPSCSLRPMSETTDGFSLHG